MSIEGFDVSGGFEEFGESWEVVSGEWGERAVVDKTNDIELENVQEIASKIFWLKLPEGLDFSQTKELLSSRKTRDWKITDSHSPKQASYLLRENEWPHDLSRRQLDILSFKPKAWHERNQVVPIRSSQRLQTLGASNKEMLIMGINGIGTDIEAARDHQAYLKSFVPDNVGVDFIHNNSNSIVVDVIEALGLNYFGFSPNTANLLQETWTEFHEYHQDNPAKKILHVCHSQGAIHTYNALINCPQEVRDRLFIIEIAPAKTIPDGICYRSLIYASERDFVHLGELTHAGFFDPNETGMSKRLEIIQKAREGLTLLPPHPDAEKFDHGLQSPTFKPKIKSIIDEYISRRGDYFE
jgi:hypothetical protein